MSVTYALEDQVAVVTFDDGKANVYTHDVLRRASARRWTRRADPGRSGPAAGRPAGALLRRVRPGHHDGRPRAHARAGRRREPASSPGLLLEPLPWSRRAPVMPWRPAPWYCSLPISASGYRATCKIGLNEVAIGMALPVWAVELARYRMPPVGIRPHRPGPDQRPRRGVPGRFPRPRRRSRRAARGGRLDAADRSPPSERRRGRYQDPGPRATSPGACSTAWRAIWPD